MKFELVHIGINCENEQEAITVAKGFSALFGWDLKVGNSSVFSGEFVECMKAPYLGRNGHVAVGTSNLEEAVAFLKNRGVSINEASVKRNKDGQTVAVYLNDEIGGFAVHLLKV